MTTFLVEATVQMSGVLLAGLGIWLLSLRRSAVVRHWILLAALGCAAVVPVVSRVTPPWLTTPRWVLSLSTRIPADAGSVARPPVAPTLTTEFETSVVAVVTPGNAADGFRATAVVPAIWLAGVVVSLLGLLTGLVRLHRLTSRARPVEHVEWLRLADQVRRAAGVSRPVRILQSDHPSLIATWGLLRPQILVPGKALDWTADRVRIVLAHEFAHVRRHDWIAQLAADTLRAICWFNPLLWVVCTRLRAESERACDDAVLADGFEGTSYADHLLAIARTLTSGRRARVPAPAMARPSSLEGRISAMLDTAVDRRPLSRRHRVATLGALLMVTLAIAALSAQQSFYSLTGTVMDPSNRVLPNAKLVLVNSTSQAKHEVRTDGTGKFEFVGLPPAPYKLQAILPGFATLEDDIVLGGNVERHLRLEVGSLEETVTVDASAPAPSPEEVEAKRQKTEAARLGFEKFQQQAKAKCAAGSPTPVGGNILPPRKVVHVSPTHPANLVSSGVGGVVTMKAVIGTDGGIRDVQDLEGPHPDLEAAAAEAVRQWRFTPTLLNCEPIEVNMKVTITFKGAAVGVGQGVGVGVGRP